MRSSGVCKVMQHNLFKKKNVDIGVVKCEYYYTFSKFTKNCGHRVCVSYVKLSLLKKSVDIGVIDICDMTHSYVRHDSFIRVP